MSGLVAPSVTTLRAAAPPPHTADLNRTWIEQLRPTATATTAEAISRFHVRVTMPVIDATATRSTPPPMFVTITDPGAHAVPTVPAGFIHGHNPRTAMNEQQIALAANITNRTTDFSHLARRSTRPLDEQKRADIDQPPQAIAADAGHGNQQQLDKDASDKHIPVPKLCVRIGTLRTSAYASARNVHDVSGERRHQIRQLASVASLWMGLSHSSSGRFPACYRVGDGAHVVTPCAAAVWAGCSRSAGPAAWLRWVRGCSS
jgi:hypothetical protein